MRQVGTGVIIPVTRNWAVNFGGDYEARPAVRLLNLFEARVGLQYRFDEFFGAFRKPQPAPVAAEAKLRELHSRVNLGGKDMTMTSQSHLEDSDIKSWKLEVRNKDGLLLRTLEGAGPPPAAMDLGDLKDHKDKELSFSLGLTSLKGVDEATPGVIEPRPDEAVVVKKIEEVTTAEDDTLWGISGRQEVYGDPFLYFLIYDANAKRLSSPDVVPSGIKLVIPRGLSAKQRHHALVRAWNRSEVKAAEAAKAKAKAKTQAADQP